MTWSLLLEKGYRMQESSIVSLFHITCTYYVEDLNKINLKFNEKLNELNSKFNENMNLC
jgi:hypothetical protein